MVPVARAEDARAAEALILEHLPDIVTLCNRLFVQATDAQDATHEAVMAILRALPSYRGDGPVRHWLLKVALNAARGHRRKLSRKTQRETALPDPEVPRAMPTNPTEEREDREALRAAVARLPEPLREPLVLSYYHGLTQAQIGACVGCSQKTVHQRVKKGLEQLNRMLAGNAALGALLAAPISGRIALDTVSAAQIASVQQSIAQYYAAAGAAAAAAAAAAGHGLAATGLATGGIVMQAKSYAGIALLAVTCLLGGAALSDRVFASGSDGKQSVEVADLQERLAAEQAALASLRTELAKERRHGAARIAELNRQLELLRGRVERDERRAKPRSEAAAPKAPEAPELSRKERWKKIQDELEGVLKIFRRMQEAGANQFELGPLLVAELGKLPVERYEEMVAFDASETDAVIIETIGTVLLQAFVFVPATDPLKDTYMERYLERAQSGRHGDDFTQGALRRVSFSMPPFVDGYGKLVAPLGPDLKRKFLEEALDRAAGGKSDSLRLDGTSFLRYAEDPRATAALMRVFGETANSKELRLTALDGLASRADRDVLQLLHDASGTEEDAELLAAIEKAAARVEKRVSKKR